jgi:E3 ubiquitin-protein ligase listerin
MSKRQFKSQASSGRVSSAFGGFGNTSSAFGGARSSVLSYVQEPIDYSAIENPNLVVAFKNLTKKDGTTKAKALEDLLEFATPSDAVIADSVLETWVKHSRG